MSASKKRMLIVSGLGLLMLLPVLSGCDELAYLDVALGSDLLSRSFGYPSYGYYDYGYYDYYDPYPTYYYEDVYYYDGWYW